MGRDNDREVSVSAFTGPIAGRLTRPTWRDPRLLIGIALIAISVVSVASVVRSADVTMPHYAASAVLTPGTVLTEADVVVTNVRVSQGEYLTADADPPWGQVVTRVVGPGELVPARALAEAETFSARPVAVPSSLPLGEDIERGAVVDVWLTESAEDGPESRLVGEALVVDQVDREGGAFSVGGTETVYVVVPVAQMADFLDAIATDGEISVVGLADAGQS